jgi:hypothetical protein
MERVMTNKFMVGDTVKLKYPIAKYMEVKSIACDGGLNFTDGSYTMAPEMYELVCNKHGVPGNKLCTPGEVAVAGLDESIITPAPALISMDKLYEYENKPVRVLSVDRAGNEDLYLGCVIVMSEWDGRVMYFDKYGKKRGSACPDLIEVKPRIKRRVWVNLYKENYNIFIYDSKITADNAATGTRLACVELDIDVEEGEGV